MVVCVSRESAVRCAIVAASILAPLPAAHAQLTQLFGPPIGTHAGNLVTNGSFEFRDSAGLPGPGATGGSVFWATGTVNSPFAVPYAWTSSGGPNTYAGWGGNLGPPVTFHGSAPLPDGVNALYFGNGQGATTSLAPIFNPGGEVTFAGTPVVQPHSRAELHPEFLGLRRECLPRRPGADQRRDLWPERHQYAAGRPDSLLRGAGQFQPVRVEHSL